MMRFKKGSKVEVLTQKEVPSGSWRCAEIIGGNGRHYTVKYDGDVELLGKGIVERVPRKAIRPCPPPVDVLQGWVSGDVVEVFHNFSWKMATVLKVLAHNSLLVRLLGSSIELKANKFDVRARLCWQDGEWILIGKASNKYEDLRFRFPSSRKDNYQSQKVDATVSRNMKVYHIGTKDTALESQVIPSRTLKRKQSCGHSLIEAYAGPKQKIRVGNGEDMRHQFNLTNQPQLPDKGRSCGFIHLGSKCKKDDTGICHLCFGVTLPISASNSFPGKLMMLFISLLYMAGCCILPFGAMIEP